MSEEKKLDESRKMDLFLRGFIASVRDIEKFKLYQDVFTFLGKHYLSTPEKKDKVDYQNPDIAVLQGFFNEPNFASIWEKIKALYKNRNAPIKVKDADNRLKEEQIKLQSDLIALFPSLGETNLKNDSDKAVINFIHTYTSRSIEQTEGDFTSLKDFLETRGFALISSPSKTDLEERKHSEKKFQTSIENRKQEYRKVFVRGTTQVVASNSERIKKLLTDVERSKRLPFHAGVGVNSMDQVLEGFHNRGLIVLLGSTSAGKTLCLSSIAANHVKKAFLEPYDESTGLGYKKPRIWGFIGEDGEEEYVRRICCNVMNSLAQDLLDEHSDMSDEQDKILQRNKDLAELKKVGMFSLGKFNEFMSSNEIFRNICFDIIDNYMDLCEWIKAPEDPEEKVNFSTMNLLNIWTGRIETLGAKPEFIIIDYLNLLHLPNKKGGGDTRANELSLLTHLIDDWSNQHNIAILTAVQASAQGMVGTRELRFLEIEDLHESKSIAHHSRMIISLLPIQEFNAEGKKLGFKMGMKILKNRHGERGGIFLSDLEYAPNITFCNTKHLPDNEWRTYRNNILEILKQIEGGEVNSSNNKNNNRSSGSSNQRRPLKDEVKHQDGDPKLKDTGSL